ncbi:hypothetical protein FOCC_FOCC005666 [Frankliniella occidentalis]|nr:hypothetical protein FOCC_FOCC005666 [Frankliniella occidentalis]
MTLETIRQATGEDEELQLVIKSLRSGRWPKELSAYQLLEPQLAECNGLLAKEDKIVVPKSLQLQVLILAHEGHLGITATKQTLRLKVWWMGVDKCVEDFVATCFGCQLINKNFTPEPLVSTPMPAHAWEYMGVDYFSFKTYHLLVMVDYFSRYLKVEIAKDESAKSTIQILEKVFWEWGRPEKLASDNGPCFEAREFQEFLRTWGVVHVHASALWPQANGEVERQNRNLLKRLQIAQGTKSEWTRELWTYVHAYNNTPHGTTGVPPAQLFFSKRPLLTKLPLLDKSKEAKWCMEEVREREALNKWKSKSYADKKRHAEKSGIQVGDQVLRKNENRNNKTDPPRDPDPATVIHRQGSSVVVKTPTGNVLERNVSFFSPLKTPVQAKQDSNNNTESVEKSPSGTLGEDRPQKTAETPRPSGSPKTGEGVGQEQKMTETPKKSGEGPRRGGRLRQRPLYFKDFVTE